MKRPRNPRNTPTGRRIFTAFALLTAFAVLTMGVAVVTSGVKLAAADPAPPSLLADKRVSDTTPAPGTSFAYTVRFRCASTFDPCLGATLTDTVPAGLTIVAYSQAGGLVSGASISGSTITWNLVNPLPAGSTGLVWIAVSYPTCNAGAPLDPAPVTNSATFAASNSVPTSTAVSSPAVDGDLIPICAGGGPVGPNGSFHKEAPSQPTKGGVMSWLIDVVSKPAPYTIEDVLPAGLNVAWIGLNYGAAGVTSLEVDCGAGYVTISGTNLITPIPECPNTGSLFTGDVRYPTITRVRWTIAANSVAQLSMQTWVDPNAPSGTAYENCATSSVDGQTCGTGYIYPGPRLGYEKVRIGSPGIPAARPAQDYGALPIGVPQGDMDLVFGAIARKVTNDVLPIVEPVITDLLDANLEYVPVSEGGTNWQSAFYSKFRQWMGDYNGTLPAACSTPTFEVVDNFAGTGRQLLRWKFVGCTIPGGDWNQAQVGVYFSARIKATTPATTVIQNHTQNLLLTDTTLTAPLCANSDPPPNDNPVRIFYDNPAPHVDALDYDGDGNTSETNCPSNSVAYTVPIIANADSAKWVQGALDTSWSRYPASGDTDTAGTGEYELIVTNRGNTPLSSIDLVDILPHVGDTSVTSPATSRWSEWGEQMVSLDAVERQETTNGAWSAIAPADIVSGFSTTTNPCRWDSDDPSETNRLTAANGVFGADASITGPAGCVNPVWNSTAAGARSFALKYTAGTAIPPLGSVRIKVTVELAPGEAPVAPVSGKIAWNSFGFSGVSTAAAPNDKLLSTEPIQVGLKMNDTAVTASLGDYVWIDENHDGIQNEPTGVEGVLVSLYRGGVFQETTFTDATGFYRFNGLDPNAADYEVRLDNAADFAGGGALAGYELTVSNAGGNDATDSDGIDVGGVPTIASTPTGAAGSHTPTYDFGFWLPASLGDYVWEDVGDRNGVQDPTDAPVEGATVVLHNATTGAVLATTTTDATGHYLFDNLTAGTYYVVFDVSTATSTGVSGQHNNPTLYTFTAPNATGDEVNDSDPDSNGRTADITLVAGQHDPRWDAGIAPPPAPGPNSIGDYTWIDLNENGLQDAGEPVLAGVTVSLLDQSGFVIASDVTDATGVYLFSNLPDGIYSLHFEAPDGYRFTLQDDILVATDTTDSDANAVTGATIDTELGQTIGVDDPAPENDMTWDAGFIPTFSLGNIVWEDVNDNGLRDITDPLEVGIAGVAVRLYESDGTTEVPVGPDGILGTADDAVGGVLTNSTGHYLFTNLDAGAYIVAVTPPAGRWSSIGNGADPSTTGATHEGAPTPDEDLVALDNDDNGSFDTGTNTVRSKPVILSYLAEPTGDGLTSGWPDATPNANANYQLDFGFISTEPTAPSIFDLALIKTRSSGQPAVTNASATDVSFDITVKNQGDVAASSVVVTDYLPAGFFLDIAATNAANVAETNVTNNGDGTFTLAALAPGASETFTVVVTSDDPGTGAITETIGDVDSSEIINGAEISDDGTGHPADVDSTPNANANDDAFYLDPTNPTDPRNSHNNIDHNDPAYDETSEDEDDHDRELVTVASIDLKKYVQEAATAPAYDPASDATLGADAQTPATAVQIPLSEDALYRITITNNGNKPLGNVVVDDHIAACAPLNRIDDGVMTVPANDNGDTNTASGLDNTDTILDIGERWVYECTLAAVSAALTNIADVTADPVDISAPTTRVGTPVTHDDPANIDTIAPGAPNILLKKYAQIAPAVAYNPTDDTTLGNDSQTNTPNDAVIAPTGSNITHRITITNTGGYPFGDVQVDDALADCAPLNRLDDGNMADPADDRGDTNTASSTDDTDTILDIAERWTYECTRPNIAASYTNTATVNAEPRTVIDPITPTGDPRVNDDDPSNILTPTIELKKYVQQAPATTYNSGIDATLGNDAQTPPQAVVINYDTNATYRITITNTGDVPLGNIATDDALATCAPLTLIDNADGDSVLVPGERWVYECTQPNVTTDTTNTATTTADPVDISAPTTPIGTPVSDNDPANVTTSVDAAIQLKKFVQPAPAATYDSGDLATLGSDAQTPQDAVAINYLSTATYRLQVTNTGNVPLGDVQLDDALAECGPLGPVDVGDGDTILAVGEIWVFECSILAITAPIENTATVNAEPRRPSDTAVPTGDPRVSDDDPAHITTTAPYDLALIKTLDSTTPNPAALNDLASFTITVRNQGYAPSGAFTVTDTIPAGTVFVSATQNGVDNGDGTVTWSIASTNEILRGQEVSFGLTLRITDATKSTYRNYAEISSDSGDDIDSDPDRNIANDPLIDHNNLAHDGVAYDERTEDEDDHDIADLVVNIRDFDLRLVKELGSVDEEAHTATWRITVENLGNADYTTTLTVSDPLPRGLTHISSSGDGWICSTTNETVTCTRPSGVKAGGTTPPILIVTAIEAKAGEEIRNAAVVAAEIIERTTTNNTGEATLLVGRGSGQGAVPSQLPFSGTTVSWFLLLGGALILAGFGIRRASHRRET